MATVDLLIGSDIGADLVEEVDPKCCGCVFTLEERTARRAVERGMTVSVGDVNQLIAAGNPPRSPLAISVHYTKILTPPTLAQYRAVYNLHPGFLPWGRGWYPIFWALWEGTPAGATLHEMNSGIDKGPIVEQTEVPYDESDTGGSVFMRVRKAEAELFRRHWRRLCTGEPLPTRPQPPGGSYRSRQDFVNIKEQTDWRSISSETLVRLVRCLTVEKYPGFTIEVGGKLFELQLRAIENKGRIP